MNTMLFFGAIIAMLVTWQLCRRRSETEARQINEMNREGMRRFVDALRLAGVNILANEYTTDLDSLVADYPPFYVVGESYIISTSGHAQKVWIPLLEPKVMIEREYVVSLAAAGGQRPLRDPPQIVADPRVSPWTQDDEDKEEDFRREWSTLGPSNRAQGWLREISRR